MDCHAVSLQQWESRESPSTSNEREIIADIFKDEIAMGDVKTEHVLFRKETLELRLPNYEDNKKFMKRVLDIARKLASNNKRGKYFSIDLFFILRNFSSWDPAWRAIS